MKRILLTLLSIVAVMTAHGDNHWKLDVNPLSFENYEGVIVRLLGDEYEVGAFVLNNGDGSWECRGVQQEAPDDNGIRVINVYGNEGETIYLRVWNKTTNALDDRVESFILDMSLPLVEIDFENSTDIQDIVAVNAPTVQNSAIYDLSGRKIADKSYGRRKIVIINGKKHIR